jgi:hypothetical protein
MIEQDYRERLKLTDIAEGTEQDTTNPVADSDPLAGKAPEEAVLIHETPMDGTVAAVSPMNETIPYKAPVGEPIADESGVSKLVPSRAPTGETITREAPIGTNAGSSAALLNHEESEHFRTRWNEIQGNFVDEPRSAVEQADALVSEVVGKITQMFANEHSSLESQWKQGNDVSTEDLRKALQRYRSFFNRLIV